MIYIETDRISVLNEPNIKMSLEFIQELGDKIKAVTGNLYEPSTE